MKLNLIKSGIESNHFLIENKQLGLHYNYLIKNIKPCFSNKIELKPNNVCLNTQKNCIIKMPFEMIYTKVKCPCPKKSFKFDCNNGYCAKDLKSCESLQVLSKRAIRNSNFRHCSYPVSYFILLHLLFLKFRATPPSGGLHEISTKLYLFIKNEKLEDE